MFLVCTKCGRTFRHSSRNEKQYEKDGLCGVCRSRKNNHYSKYIKTKLCPDCGKTIYAESIKCGSCSQIGKDNHNFVNGRACKDRVCSACGKEITSGSNNLCSACYLSSINGSNNPNYKHGHYIGLLESSVEYKNWRTQVYKRDRYTCRLCGNNTSGNLQAHHILPKRDYPELIFTVENGITLCKECHTKTFGNEYKFTSTFSSILHAELKLRELGEGCNANTEPSLEGNFFEGVETRDDPKFFIEHGNKILQERGATTQVV